MRWLFILVFAALPARAQVVVELAGGASTLYESSGALATIHLPNDTLVASAGESYGHFGLSAAESRDLAGWAVTVGNRQFSATAGGAGVGLGVLGVSATRKGLTLFAGATGPSYASPYFVSASAQHFGAGLNFDHQFSHGLKADGIAVLGPKRTAVGALAYRWRILSASGAAGILENSRYWNTALDLQPVRWADINAARTTYQFATVNSSGASLQAGPLNFHASIFRSAQSSGEAYGAGARLGRFEVRADEFKSKYGANLAGMLGEKISRRFTVQEFINENAGHIGFNAGGTYSSNRFTLSISQAVYFMPLYVGRSPFQKSLALTLSFRAPHDSAATLQTNVDPTGHLKWGAFASSYAYGNWQPQERHAARGGFVISGSVTSKSGMPVSGAAVSIGGVLVYSDASGAFTARVRRVPAAVAVSLDDFSAPGTWLVDSAPATAQPGTPVAIIVTNKY